MFKQKSDLKYQRTLKELLANEPELRVDIERRVKLFLKSPDDTRLNNHSLHGKLYGKWAFSITDNVRIVYEWTGKNKVKFLAIGGHKEVYK